MKLSAMRCFAVSTLVFASALVAVASDATAQTRVRYAQSGTGLIYLVTDVARAKGFFKEEGLDPVEVLALDGGARAAQAVLAGEASFAPGFFHVVYSWTEGQLPEDRRFVAISTTLAEFALQIVASNNWVKKANITPQTSVDDRIRALKGARIGISAPGSSTDTFLRMILPPRGLNPESDITMVPLGTGGPLLAGLERGAVDAIVWLSPIPETAEKRGVGKVLINQGRGDVPELRGFYYIGDFTTRQFIRQNPKIVQGWLNGTAKAIKFIRENPEQVVELAKTMYPDADQSVLPDAVRSMIAAVPASPVVTAKGVQQNFDMMSVGKPKKISLPFDQVVNNTFAEAAAKSILGK